MYSLCKIGAQKCSDVKGSLEKVKKTFVCRCLGSKKEDEWVEELGKGMELEVIKLCYLGSVGDMLDADGSVYSAVTTRVTCDWNKSKELRPFLTAKGDIPDGGKKWIFNV
jgi:hypothetical protein